MLTGTKCVENRHFTFRPGWYAVHTGAKHDSVESQEALLAAVPGMPPEAELPHSAIVGAVKFTHALELEQCANAEQWAFGPKVNVISEYCRLEHPVQHSGALSTWRISDDALPLVQCGLASATRCKNDVSHLPAGGSVCHA